MNNHSSRSILPFKDEFGTWIIDTSFKDDPLFSCLQNVNFDPFTGNFLGKSSVNLSFDGIEDGHFIDYSSSDTKVSADGVSLGTGRIGKGAKFDPKSTITIPFDLENGINSFFIDCHISLDEALKSENETIVFSSTGKGMSLTAISDNDLVNLSLEVPFTNGQVKIIRFSIASELWFHLNVTSKNGFLSVSLDGNEISSLALSPSSKIVLGDFVFGGNGSAKYKLDELVLGR